MKKSILFLLLLCMVLLSSPTIAATVAYWRFELGPVNTNVVHGAADGVWAPDIADVSGNNYALSAWTSADYAGYRYRDSVPGSPIPRTGAANTLSVKNTGGVPGMWTSSTAAIRTITPAQWTIEVSIKPENGGYRTYIGRDSIGTVAAVDNQGQPQAQSGQLSALYLQAITAGDLGLTNALAIKFCDVTGIWHQAVSASNVFQGFDWGSDPDGLLATWYNVVAVSDGRYLSLYLNDVAAGTGCQLIAQTDMSLRSTDTRLTAGAGDGGDWDAGNWTVGRGLFNGGHTDRGYGYIDEVRISDTALRVDEFLFYDMRGPRDPVVEQEADEVNNDVDVMLNWKAGEDPNKAQTGNEVLPEIVDQYVFMNNGNASDPNLYFKGATGEDPGLTNPNSSYGPINLAFDKTYKWAVVEALEGYEQSFTVNVSTLADVDPNNIIGPIWSFDSIASVPVINPGGQPVGVLTDGTSAEFSVSVSSLSQEHYAWYRSTDKANDTPGDDISVGTDSATLSLTGIDVVEGFYYCVITNDSATAVVSNPAFLEIRGLVAWYAFENDITDSEGENDGTPIKNDPNIPFTYVTGVVDQAISLNGIDEAVEIPRTIQNSMTIELWVKTTETVGVGGGWFDGDGLVDGEVAGFDHNDFGTSLRGTGFSFGVGNINGANLTVNSTSAINDGQWHYCVATRDHVTGEIRVYVDGSQEASGIAPLGTKDEPVVLRIGSLQTGLNFLACQVDELKLYNYPLTDLQVAVNYNAITGESVCVESERPDATYDFNGDCIINLEDFADLAAAWLDCGLYPDCL